MAAEQDARRIRKRVATLKPSPENAILYRPIREDDPATIKMAETIAREGRLREDLVITQDNYVVSGHRRLAALKRLGRDTVHCRQLPVRRDTMPQGEYLVLLRGYNDYRDKSAAEQVREELIDLGPDEALASLRARRDRSVNAHRYNGVKVVDIEGSKRRCAISEAKDEHVKHILKVLQACKPHWPVSDRAVHYKLCNYQFIRGHYHPKRTDADWGGPPRPLSYLNDHNSYKATCELLTRLRLDGTVPWEALDDFTRPFEEFLAFRDVREFVEHELENLFDGFWRDLLQSQPNHVEILCEKNTIYHMVMEVARKYTIPVQSGRGYNSIDPYHDLVERYRASGKERLVLIVLTDHDPEGQDMPHVAGRTLRDDFGIPGALLDIVQAGVTRDQVRDNNLAQNALDAKDTSSRYGAYVERNRDWFEKELGWQEGQEAPAWELESLDPDVLLPDLEKVIKGVLDMDLFNREAQREHEEDAPALEATRRAALERLKGLVG
jgi:hypothetical protein